jgi:hypothetical protein
MGGTTISRALPQAIHKTDFSTHFVFTELPDGLPDHSNAA